MSSHTQREKIKRISIFETAIFAMLAALMFASKQLMEVLPNIHLIGMFTATFTVVYRWKALIPIYIFVVLEGLISGFSLWWIPYLYIWTVLWAVFMVLPKNMKKGAKAVVYPILCGLHGFLYGTLYAPAQALMFGLNFEGMLAWIVAGLPFDAIHGVSNLVCGLFILPLSRLMTKLDRKYSGTH